MIICNINTSLSLSYTTSKYTHSYILHIYIQTHTRYVLVLTLSLFLLQVKATLLQLEVLQPGIEERLSAPPTPCLSCADWFLPAGSARERLENLASSSPVLSRLAGAVRGSSLGPSGGSRARSLFGEKARRSSPQRSLPDGTSEGHAEAGFGSASAPAAHSTPDSQRKSGGRGDSLGSGGSEGGGASGGLFKVHQGLLLESLSLDSDKLLL